MNLKELAPWVAIAITLILSILVPVFTQIANNRFQLKMKTQENEKTEKERAYLAFEDFFVNVGGSVMHTNHDTLREAGASIQRLYLYLPEKYWNDLDVLFSEIRKMSWGDAQNSLTKISKIIAQEMQKI